MQESVIYKEGLKQTMLVTQLDSRPDAHNATKTESWPFVSIFIKSNSIFFLFAASFSSLYIVVLLHAVWLQHGT